MKLYGQPAMEIDEQIECVFLGYDLLENQGVIESRPPLSYFVRQFRM